MCIFFFQAEDGIRDKLVTGVQTCALPILTAEALATVSDAPRVNILVGARYLDQLLGRFNGDVELALAAYNAGPTAVEKLGGAPSLATLRYAKNVEARAASLPAC